MKAMIFAAGMGTRLGNITKEMPKALVEVHGKPMLEHVINYLKKYGVNQIIINVHHLGSQIQDYIHQKKSFDIQISFSDESDALLDTGGGLLKAFWFFDDNKPFVVHNADILSNINLTSLMAWHNQQKNLATLAVKTRNTSRYFLVNADGRLCGWKNKKTEEELIVFPGLPMHEVAFSGIQIVEPRLFSLCSLQGKFSLTAMYLKLAKNNMIGTFTGDYDWFDLGSTENIAQAERQFKFEY